MEKTRSADMLNKDALDNYVARHDKLLRHLQMQVEIATPEFSRVIMPITEHHLNGMRVAHGGVIFALADVAFGAAANAGRKTGVVSLTSSIEFLQPGKIGPLVGEARAVRQGRHIMSYDVNILDGQGALVARAISTGFVTDTPLPD